MVIYNQRNGIKIEHFAKMVDETRHEVNNYGILGSNKKGKIINSRKKKKGKKKQCVPGTKCDSIVVQCNKFIVKWPPVVTKDSKHILVPYGNSVGIFQMKSGLLEDSFCEHKYEVKNIYINERDPSQAISCSSRELIIWDYSDQEVVKRYDFDYPASAWYINPRSYEDVYYKGTYLKDGKRQYKKEHLIKWNITNSYEPIPLGKVSKKIKSVVLSRNGEYVAYSYKNKLSVFMSSRNTKETYTYGSQQLTCIAFHPAEQIVAGGDTSGKIILWYIYSGKICTTLHWHSSNVVDLLFTNDGCYLMSGGNEGVLVMWQIETRGKTFLPRVGVVRHLTISSDDQYMCLSLDNNVIKIISTVTSNLKKAIKFLAPAYEITVGLRYHAPTDCLVLNGRPDGVLQFYEPNLDSTKLSLDIVGENYVPSVNDRYVYPTRVLLVDFNCDGTWMATVSEREDCILPTERLLKFWKYSPETKNYTLNTLVDPPHKNRIHSLRFRPANASSDFPCMAVTTSADGYLKSWVLTEETNRDGEIIESWQILSIGNFGMKSCHHASFSQEGNILAVLFSAVTLWDPESLTFKRCLQFNVKDDVIKKVEFGYNESQHFLIGHSDNYLVVWNINNLMDCTVAWMMKAEVQLIACDPYSKYFTAFVVFKEVMDMYLFDPTSATPLNVHTDLTYRHAPVSDALFLPKSDGAKAGKSIWSKVGQLYILTEKTEILTIRNLVTERDTIAVDRAEKEKYGSSSFEEMFGSFSERNNENIHGSDDEDDQEHALIPHGNPSSTILRKMMSTPVNVLPSADVISRIYMKSLIKKQYNDKNEEEQSMEIDLAENDDTESYQKLVTNAHNLFIPAGEMKNVDYNAQKPERYTPSKQLVDRLSCLSFASLPD